ncbi:MAG: redoxin family protein [Alphaproteobacteria bacterium]|nr:redoxin family protein [Alphaproteobacteria bacterium]
MTRVIYVLPLLVIAILAYLFVQLLLKEDTIELINRPVPEFSLPLFAQEGKNLTQKDLEGNIAVVNFFASWCLPCAVEMQSFKIMQREHAIRIFGIAFNNRPEEVDIFIKKFGNPFYEIALDQNSQAAPAWGMNALPESFVIDAKNRIRYHHIGMVRPEHIEEIFLPIIAKLKAEEQNR